jgi:hypothetical protein
VARVPRAELFAVAAFLALDLGVPAFFEEMYPFSRMALFTDAPQRMAAYEIRSPDGRSLPLSDFGLQRSYAGERGFNAQHPGPHPSGLRAMPTLDRMGEVPRQDDLVRVVREHLASSGLPYVDLAVDVYEPSADGRMVRRPVSRARVARDER